MPAFVPRGDLTHWEPDPTGHSAGTVWVRMIGQWVGFIMFFDPESADFDFGGDLRFVHDDESERLRRWLIDEVNRHFPHALMRPEGEP
jgi:hypothetical protein